MVHALALIAAAVSIGALLIVVSLTVFVVSLAFRAHGTSDSRRHTAEPRASTVGAPRASRPRTGHDRGARAGTDRLA